MRYFIGTLICSTILFAQTETLTIDAQNFEADDKKGISIFTGNVKIKMGQDRLNADKVDVYFIRKRKKRETENITSAFIWNRRNQCETIRPRSWY